MFFNITYGSPTWKLPEPIKDKQIQEFLIQLSNLHLTALKLQHVPYFQAVLPTLTTLQQQFLQENWNVCYEEIQKVENEHFAIEYKTMKPDVKIVTQQGWMTDADGNCRKTSTFLTGGDKLFLPMDTCR